MAMRGSTTALSRAPQIQVPPSLSPSQVCRLFASGYLGGTDVIAETGTQVWLYGGPLDAINAHGGCASFPTADYKIDGYSGESLDRNAALPRAYLITAGSQQPVIDHVQRKFIYFQTTRLADDRHTVNIVVTKANEANPFILDYFRIIPSTGDHSSVGTSPSVPSSTTTPSGLPTAAPRSAPVGAIVGGAVGGIAAIVTLALALLWFFLTKRARGGQVYYFEKSSTADILAGEGPLTTDDPAETVEGLPIDSSSSCRTIRYHRYHPYPFVRWLRWPGSSACTPRNPVDTVFRAGDHQLRSITRHPVQSQRSRRLDMRHWQLGTTGGRKGCFDRSAESGRSATHPAPGLWNQVQREQGTRSRSIAITHRGPSYIHTRLNTWFRGFSPTFMYLRFIGFWTF